MCLSDTSQSHFLSLNVQAREYFFPPLLFCDLHFHLLSVLQCPIYLGLQHQDLCASYSIQEFPRQVFPTALIC